MQQLLVQAPSGHGFGPPRTRPETTCSVAHGIRPAAGNPNAHVKPTGVPHGR
jgi:hypothetical protein